MWIFQAISDLEQRVEGRGKVNVQGKGRKRYQVQFPAGAFGNFPVSTKASIDQEREGRKENGKWSLPIFLSSFHFPFHSFSLSLRPFAYKIARLRAIPTSENDLSETASFFLYIFCRKPTQARNIGNTFNQRVFMRFSQNIPLKEVNWPNSWLVGWCLASHAVKGFCSAEENRAPLVSGLEVHDDFDVSHGYIILYATTTTSEKMMKLFLSLHAPLFCLLYVCAQRLDRRFVWKHDCRRWISHHRGSA